MTVLVETMPRRIQLSRRRGWRLAAATCNPNGARAVTRSTPWGNPFVPILETGTATWRITARVPATNISPATIVLLAGHQHVGRHQAFEDAVHLYRLGWENHAIDLDVPVHELLADLRGLDLACFCSLDDICHADVALELANPGWEKPA
jgi:hypothetical protein